MYIFVHVRGMIYRDIEMSGSALDTMYGNEVFCWEKRFFFLRYCKPIKLLDNSWFDE